MLIPLAASGERWPSRSDGRVRGRVSACTPPLLATASLLFLLPLAPTRRCKETPFFAKDVAAGKLPPVVKRIPSEPALAELEQLGKPGGDLRMLMASAKDSRMMVVYGYARLVAYTPGLAIVPDILLGVDQQEGRIFTLHLRPGHKWSDGQPFTAEDFRYWFEDIAENEELSPTGVPLAMLVDGKPPKFEVIDDTTVRYSWDKPNPLFLSALAGPDPMFIYAPAHYLAKQFHQKYADPAKLAELIKDAGMRNWGALHTKRDSQYHNDNPKLPTLDPWVLKTKLPADRIVFERNPYYYRVDGAGHQLPYIDRVVFSIADSKIIPAKTGAGESDLQARYLRFDDYTLLEGRRGGRRLSRAAVAHRPGEPAGALPEPQRQRRGLAQIDARRAVPPCAVAGGQPPRDQPGALFRPGARRPEHGAAAKPAIPRRVSRLVELRSRPGEQAARRDRPDPEERRRHPPSARRTALRGHRRGFRRIEREIRCARAGARFLAAYRRAALFEARAADPVPPPGLRRRYGDVARQGYRERPRHRDDVALRIRAEPARNSSNGPNGATTPKTKGKSGEALRLARGAEALPALR